MENMARYRFGDGSEWPGCPIVCDVLHDEFEPFTERLTISRLDPDTTLPDYGYTGMLLLTAQRTAA